MAIKMSHEGREKAQPGINYRSSNVIVRVKGRIRKGGGKQGRKGDSRAKRVAVLFNDQTPIKKALIWLSSLPHRTFVLCCVSTGNTPPLAGLSLLTTSDLIVGDAQAVHA
jgi:hypothetical protein